MSERDAVFVARAEGLSVEFDTARHAFVSAAASMLRGMEDGIVCRYPQFYSNEERARAGVPVDWQDPLYPRESKAWRDFNASVCAVLAVRSRP